MPDATTFLDAPATNNTPVIAPTATITNANDRARQFLDAPAASARETGISNQAIAATQVGPQPRTQPTQNPELSFEQRNSRGIPIDLSLEPHENVRSGVLMRDRPEDKVAFLEGFFGKGNARLADNGEPLVTVWDEQRKTPVEIPALGYGFQGEDVEAHIVAAIPETLGALTGLGVGSKIKTASRFLKFSAEMIGSATGQEAGGLAKDVAAGSLTPMDQLVKERAERIPMTTVGNVLAVGAAKPLSYIATPLRGQTGPVEMDLKEARDYFQKRFGVDYPLSIGEETGSSVAKRVEASMSRLPGSSRGFEKLQGAKLDAFRSIQGRMLAGGATAEDATMLNKLEEDVGDEAISAIRQKVDPIVRAEQTARSEAETKANFQVMRELGSAAGAVRQLQPEKVGEAIRTSAFAKRNAFKSEADKLYASAYEQSGGTDKILEPTKLAEEAKKLLAEQPAPLVTTTTPTGVLGPGGEPLMATTTEAKLQREFVNPEVVKDLQALVDLDTAKFSLRDLVRMRSHVSDQIAQGEAIPGVETHYLGKIRNLLTGAIEESTAALPDQSLKTAWETANAFYKNGVKPFEDRNIARLFKDIESGAFVQDEDIVKRIGPTEYESFKKFLGEGSPEFGALKRAILDTVVESARLPGREVLDGARLVSNINNLVVNNRTVAEDILGSQRIAKLSDLGRLTEAVQKGERINAADFQEALASGADLNTAIRKLTTAQDSVAKVYRSQIVKDIAQGNIGENFDTTRFVNYYFTEASPEELKALQKHLTAFPEVQEDLRRKAIERLFLDAQGRIAKGDTTRIGGGELFRLTNTGALEKAFGNEQNQERLKIILGDDTFKDFRMLAQILRGGEVAERTFATTGGFAAQMQVADMLRGGVLGYLTDYLKQKVAAIVYSNPAITAMAKNQMFSGEQGQLRLARMIVGSKPFLAGIQSDFPGQDSWKVMQAVHNSIDLFAEKGSQFYRKMAPQDWTDRVIDQQQQQPIRRVFPLPVNEKK